MHISRKAVAVTTAALVVGVGGGIGLANATAPSDKVYACAAKTSGALRQVSPSTRCKSTEKSVVWSVKGPQGEPGADGTDGADGADGVSGYEIVDESFSFTYTGAEGPRAGYTVTADCPTGKKAVGGGAAAGMDSGGRAHVESSHPIFDGSGWTSNVVKSAGLLVAGDRMFGNAYAVCVNVTPDPV